MEASLQNVKLTFGSVKVLKTTLQIAHINELVSQYNNININISCPEERNKENKF